MNPSLVKDQFLQSSTEWICDSFSLAIRYLAIRDSSGIKILDAALTAGPSRITKEFDFSIEARSLVAGQKTFPSVSKDVLIKRLRDAANGRIEVNGLHLALDASAPLSYYTDPPHQEKWAFNLNLLVQGNSLPSLEFHESIELDQALRCVNPPFDGLNDLSLWLQLSDPRAGARQPRINVLVNPPVDVMFDGTSLAANQLRVLLNAHPKFDVSQIGLAIREFPGAGIKARKQVGSKILWKRVKNGRRPGTLDLSLAKADSVLTMLTVYGRVVRRQWFFDPNKAINSRYVATQLFDKELKQIKDSVLNPIDQDRFERGIASLLFLLGFAPAIQVEKQAPDIVLTTPGSKIAVVECTMKIGDFQNKLGKLVERRNALMEALNTTGHNLRVDAFLVCALPKTQIAVDEGFLTQHQVTLLSREELSQAFDRTRVPISPDEMLDSAAEQLAARRNVIG